MATIKIKWVETKCEKPPYCSSCSGECYECDMFVSRVHIKEGICKNYEYIDGDKFKGWKKEINVEGDFEYIDYLKIDNEILIDNEMVVHDESMVNYEEG